MISERCVYPANTTSCNMVCEKNCCQRVTTVPGHASNGAAPVRVSSHRSYAGIECNGLQHTTKFLKPTSTPSGPAAEAIEE